MLNLLMYQRDFHKIALECVLTIVSHDPTMPSPQDYSINSETHLQSAMQKLYLEFIKALNPSHDVRHDYTNATFVQEANRMNFVLSSMQQLDPFATHVAKAFLRHAIHKKNADMQILDTILILLRKSYVVFERYFRTSYSLARTQVQYDSNGRFRDSNGKTDVRESVEKQL